ncbi:hypothetical protein C0581_03145 [Candidatus Parcubacteria bacterium]|nr:MAG: hypothetical protein C0581_03145 [Candidatus Parcubacteria bacterium]
MNVKKSTNKKESEKKKPRKKSTAVSKKNTKRKATPKKPRSKKDVEKKELEQAVKKIPALVMKEMDSHKPPTEKHIDRNVEQQAPIKKKQVVPIYEPPHKGKTWLWMGVVIFSIAIFILWALNLSTMFYETKRTPDPAFSIIESGKEDLQNIIKTFSKDEELEESTPAETTIDKADDAEIENTIKETLTNIFNTTSTINTSTTNTIQSEL